MGGEEVLFMREWAIEENVNSANKGRDITIRWSVLQI